MTKVESLKTSASFTPNSQRTSIPVVQASYFAMLLVASKQCYEYRFEPHFGLSNGIEYFGTN